MGSNPTSSATNNPRLSISERQRGFSRRFRGLRGEWGGRDAGKWGCTAASRPQSLGVNFVLRFSAVDGESRRSSEIKRFDLRGPVGGQVQAQDGVGGPIWGERAVQDGPLHLRREESQGQAAADSAF